MTTRRVLLALMVRMVISVTSVRVAEILAGVAEGSPAASRLPDLLAVSYTHLTLPTIYSV